MSVVVSAEAVLTLCAGWRERATFLRRYGADASAKTLEEVAGELESLAASDGEQLLTLTDAARLSGYSADHLGRELRAGRLPNAGRRNAPKIRRADLPQKPAHLRPGDATHNVRASREQIARAAILPFVRGANG